MAVRKRKSAQRNVKPKRSSSKKVVRSKRSKRSSEEIRKIIWLIAIGVLIAAGVIFFFEQKQQKENERLSINEARQERSIHQ